MIPNQLSFINSARVHTLLCTTFLLGTFTLIGLTIAALIAVIYVFHLFLTACSGMILQISQLYNTGGSFVQLVMWLVALILFCKVSPYLALVVRKAVKL